MFRLELNPLTRRRLDRFKSIRRGWWSFWIIVFLLFLASLGPLLVGNRAILVRYQGHYFAPFFGSELPGTTFGLNYDYETNYRALKEKFAEEKSGDRVWMPLVPFGAREFCEVFVPVAKAPDGLLRREDNGEVVDETRVFTTWANGARRRTWSVSAGMLDGDMSAYDRTGALTERGKWKAGNAVSLRRLDGKPADPVTDKEMASLHTYVANPAPPLLDGHLLGTDASGVDVVARLFGGFRILVLASIVYMIFTYIIGCVLGCAMGYYGGWFDLGMQRFIEIWSNIPRLYVIIFLSAILVASPEIGEWITAHSGLSMATVKIIILMLVLVSYSWINLTYYMRTGTYREKNREYVSAARLLGAGDARIIFRHILPNTLSTLVTFVPFDVAAVVSSLTVLDFLGFGLSPTEPTWGELLKQGTENFDKPWMLTAVVVAMVSLMMLVAFVGEAIREAFDPKKHTSYE